ncbi:PKD domain-containing protein [Sediminibacterium salmoneum]|uniref:PKD domain-containing protein n=1 Tax=Sediminibacterium salmoneum TaxID=426421 RepID=UPI00047D5E36|nr:PKD domain-containing protein [Sediminibacterium salmoneum]
MRLIRNHLFICLTVLGLFACKKDAAIDLDKLVQVDSAQITKGAIVTVSRDTTTVTYGNVEAKFSQTSTCFPSSEVFTFTASGVALPAGGYYSWQFGDGNIATGATTTHSYQAAGSFVVTLMVMANANNMLAKVSFGVKALGQQTKPEASFTTKFDFPQNLSYVTFNSTSSINQGDIVQYKYSWGDGTEHISSVGLVRHEFPKVINDSTYSVKLTILSNSGCSDDTTIRLTIPGRYNIKGKFKTETFDACTNERILFTAEAENVPTGAVYEWDFSDGTGVKTGNPIMYKYKFPNDYDVIMSVKLNGREIYRTNKLVNAKGENPKPTAKFEETLVWDYPTTQRWSFNSRSTIPTSTIDSYQWSFGNGNTNNEFYSFIETVYNKETTSKSYTVQLIVTGNGCADTARKTITIPSR